MAHCVYYTSLVIAMAMLIAALGTSILRAEHADGIQSSGIPFEPATETGSKPQPTPTRVAVQARFPVEMLAGETTDNGRMGRQHPPCTEMRKAKEIFDLIVVFLIMMFFAMNSVLSNPHPFVMFLRVLILLMISRLLWSFSSWLLLD